jgi:hypothetical protein
VADAEGKKYNAGRWATFVAGAFMPSLWVENDALRHCKVTLGALGGEASNLNDPVKRR